VLEFVFSRKNPEAPVAYASFEAMHTVLEMVLVLPDDLLAKQIAEQVYRLIKELDGLFNRFDANSEIGMFNSRKKQICPISDKRVYMLLDYCEAYRKRTLGYFDITVQSRYESEHPATPYLLDERTRTISFGNSHTQLDLGGIAKGYALEEIRQLLASYSIGRALVNFGNSSVLAIGTHPYGAYWPVAVELVAQSGVSACNFELADNALSVSGLPPQKKRHIKNPLTNEYVAAKELIAVKGKSPMAAEALSTALYAAHGSDCPRIMDNYGGYEAYAIISGKGTETKMIKI
jgi:thiamine biosynthesis lipoprotein